MRLHRYSLENMKGKEPFGVHLDMMVVHVARILRLLLQLNI